MRGLELIRWGSGLYRRGSCDPTDNELLLVKG
jgi:hypothetical protein